MSDLVTTRHHVENLLAAYASLADAGDADAIGELLADAVVTFDGGEPVSGRDAIVRFYRGLGGAQRHLVSNVLVTSATDATARYSRWSLEGEPRLRALGTYHLTIDPAVPRVTRLTVTRDWQHH